MDLRFPVATTCIEIDTGLPEQLTLVHTTKEFDFGEALLSEYDILEQILSYLPYKDLHAVSQINSAFATYAESTLRKRMSPFCFSIGTNRIQHNYNCPVHPALCLMLLDYKALKLDSYVCIHTEHRVNLRKPITEFVQDDMAIAKCPIITLSCRTVISSFTVDRLLNGVIFPHIPNVKISVFHMSESKLKNISKVLDTEIGRDYHIKCLLTYSLYMNQKLLNQLVLEIQNRQRFDNFAFGGGFIKGIKSFNVRGEPKKFLKKRDELMCIAFSKPDDIEAEFNAYSIVVPEKANTDADIEKCFTNLKEYFVPRKHSVAFRITCVSRDTESVKDVKYFKKHFPDIDLLGLDGDGEIGWNHYKREKHMEHVKRMKFSPTRMIHCMSSVFLIITWGKQRR